MNDDDARSYITDDLRDGCRCLQLAIWTYVYFHPEGQFVGGFHDLAYTVDGWAQAEMDSFKYYFNKSIHDAWGNGAIWLVHGTKGIKDIWCDVQIIFTPNREDAHMCVMALKNPVPVGDADGFRAACEPNSRTFCWSDNPFDFFTAYERVVNEGGTGPRISASTGVDKDKVTHFYSQNIMAHEFGHYLRLAHPFEGDGPLGSPGDYGDGKTDWDMRDIMGRGNEFRAYRVGIPFRARLDKHDYVSSNVEAWMAKGHTASGGGDRSSRPWPDGYFPKYNIRSKDPRW